MCNLNGASDYIGKINSQEIESLKKDIIGLYHYTSLAGLQGILSTKSIWLNPFHNASDTSEISHARDIFLDVIQNFISSENFDNLKKRLDQLFFEVRYISAFTSFCESPRLENMWNEYADNKNGAVIHFNNKLATESPSDLNFLFLKMEYGDDFCRKDFENMVSALACDLIKHSGYLCKDCYLNLMSAVISVLPKYKQQKFSSENEYRICCTRILFPPESANYSSEMNNYKFKPYNLEKSRLVFPKNEKNINYRIVMPFNYNAISSIILRNNKEMSELKRNIRMLIYANHEEYYEDIDAIKLLNYFDQSN